MKKALTYTTSLLIFALALALNTAQGQSQSSITNRVEACSGELQLTDVLARARAARRGPFSQLPEKSNAKASGSLFSLAPMATGPNLPVLGGGTLGRLTKWTGFTSTNSFIGDTSIFEDKYGLVGIGTDTPTSRLAVAGTIQSLSGGFKFPDGTVQTTAGVAPTQVVRSLNGLMGDVTLAAGANIAITPTGNTLTIAAPNSLTSITHDATLTGDGTSGTPLGVAVPLKLSGAGTVVIKATNTTGGGYGVFATGGNSDVLSGGAGVVGLGGGANSGIGGDGVEAQGGHSNSASGGDGVSTGGGDSDSGNGGHGLIAGGGAGSGAGHNGGFGVTAFGGKGINGATDGLAGQFIGDVSVSGNLSKGGGSFKIDHPLDPENKYLYHSFVESPDMMNIYNGVVKLDLRGEAAVEMPEWFGALNGDFRYLLTAIGAPAPNLYIAEEISNNRFKIGGGSPGMKVSWQVTGIRQDAYANKHRILVEEDKPERERGSYLHPDAFNQPEERSVEWARSPQLMQRLKQQRLAAEQRRTQKQPDR